MSGHIGVAQVSDEPVIPAKDSEQPRSARGGRFRSRDVIFSQLETITMRNSSLVVIALIFGVELVKAGPIHDAAGGGEVEKVRRLVSEGADVNEMDRVVGMPLHSAAVKGQLEVAEVLTAEGARIDEPAGLFRATPLHMAALGGHPDLAALLLVKGADVNARDSRLNTPLHFAAGSGDITTVELLIGAGANLYARNQADVSPIQTAGKAEHFDIVDLLIANGVTPPAGRAGHRVAA
jgi:ankyrin repeat protein